MPDSRQQRAAHQLLDFARKFQTSQSSFAPAPAPVRVPATGYPPEGQEDTDEPMPDASSGDNDPNLGHGDRSNSADQWSAAGQGHQGRGSQPGEVQSQSPEGVPSTPSQTCRQDAAN